MRTKRNLKTSIVMSVLLVGMASAIAAGGTIYVDADASPGGDGSSWADAYTTIQEGIDVASEGDTVLVADGIYTGTGNKNLDFNGKAITVKSENGPANCIIDCESSGRGFNFHTGESANSIINGFTIQKGNVGLDFGGGIYCYNSSPTFVNCKITNNYSGNYGGGMYNRYSSPTLTNCTFSGNSARYYGGGMFNGGTINMYSSPTITNCTFSGNTAGHRGGGMSSSYSSARVTNCTFSGNSVGQYAGGMENRASSRLRVTNCTFSGNSAGISGGGMGNSNNSSTTVTNCILWGNGATQILGSATVSYSDVQGGWSGTGNTNVDPLFVDADGPDNIPGTEDDNLRLAFASPCIDVGDNTALPPDTADLDGDGDTTEPTPWDLDRNPRIANGIVDMGAYEGGYQIQVQTLTISSTSGGTVTAPGEGLFQYDPGTVVQITAQAEAYYHFVEWTGTAVDAGKVENPSAASTTVMMVGNYTLVANLAVDQNTLTISSTSDGTVTTPGEGSFQYDHGTVVQIIAQAEAYYHFVEWTGTAVDAGKVENPSAASTTVTMVGNYTLVANFARTIIYVDADAPEPTHDGFTWTDAYLYLQDALAAAGSGSEIWVAEGIYTPDANGSEPSGSGDRTATFQLINGVAIYGGFAGGETSLDERDWRTNETILSGDLDGNDVQGLDPCDLLDEPTRGENSYHVVTGSGTTGTAVLDGFTITAGNARYIGDDLYPYDCGGGMYNNSGSPTVVNCTFSRNSAVDVGGGMSNYNSGPTVMNCTFSGNSAAYDGGGMDNENSSPMVSNCVFIGNSATGDSWGGGMCNANESSPTVTNCTFTRNSAYYGGGMYNDEYDGSGSNPTLTNCILWGNTAPTGPQIYNEAGSSPTVSYSDVQGGWPGTENIDEDPLFIGPDGLDGIPGTADDEEDNVHLRGYSPCINAGDPSGDYSGQVDIDGQPRVAYGRVDMGADEVFPIFSDSEPDGDVDFADFAIFAGNWLLGH